MPLEPWSRIDQVTEVRAAHRREDPSGDDPKRGCGILSGKGHEALFQHGACYEALLARKQRIFHISQLVGLAQGDNDAVAVFVDSNSTTYYFFYPSD